jgi:signal transduction histidine kinase
LQINNVEIRPELELNNQQILKRNISYERELELNHLNKDFTISFSSASYVNAKGNKYRYILHGYDKQWHTGNEHSAVYTNLRSGRYSFEVFAANNDGIWSKESAIIDIRILPAPLLSNFAFLIYFVTFIIVTYFVRGFIVARIQLRNELLIEKVKRDKEEKFHQERVRFYTNISHELRTPLTLIMGPVKDLLRKDKPNTEPARLHQLKENNSQRLLSLVNQLLDFRKSIHQTMKLKVT